MVKWLQGGPREPQSWHQDGAEHLGKEEVDGGNSPLAAEALAGATRQNTIFILLHTSYLPVSC